MSQVLKDGIQAMLDILNLRSTLNRIDQLQCESSLRTMVRISPSDPIKHMLKLQHSRIWEWKFKLAGDINHMIQELIQMQHANEIYSLQMNLLSVRTTFAAHHGKVEDVTVEADRISERVAETAIQLGVLTETMNHGVVPIVSTDAELLQELDSYLTSTDDPDIAAIRPNADIAAVAAVRPRVKHTTLLEEF